MSSTGGTVTGSVSIGAYALQIGGAGGTVIQQRTDSGAEGTGTLARALEEPKPKEKGAAIVAAERVEDASGVTAKCERAISLSKGVSEGKILDPTQLGAEVGTLLDLLEKLDRKGRHKDELKIARALATLLMLLKRWSDLLRTLRTALGAAEKLDDLDAIAWTKHEIGTLRLAGGDVEGADRDLHEARDIRERIGDRRGLAATNRNLGTLCERLRQMLREEELVRRRSRGPRPMALRVLALAMLFALAFGAGVLAGNGGNSGEPAGFGGGGGSLSGPTGPSGSSGPTGEKKPKPGNLPFTVTFAGDGGGRVRGEGEGCTDTCAGEVPAGEEVTLVAEADGESTFEGFSGDCSGSTCTVTVTSETSVVATFRSTTDGGGDNQEEEKLTEEKRTAEETAEAEQTEEEQVEEASTEAEAVAEKKQTAAEAQAEAQRTEEEGPIVK